MTFSTPNLLNLECASLQEVPIWISEVDSCAMGVAAKYKKLETDKDEQTEFREEVAKVCASRDSDKVVLSCVPKEDVNELVLAGFCTAKGGVPSLAYDGRLLCTRQQ